MLYNHHYFKNNAVCSFKYILTIWVTFLFLTLIILNLSRDCPVEETCSASRNYIMAPLMEIPIPANDIRQFKGCEEIDRCDPDIICESANISISNNTTPFYSTAAIQKPDDCWMIKDDVLKNGIIPMHSPTLVSFIKQNYLDLPPLKSRTRAGKGPGATYLNLIGNDSTRYYSQIGQDKERNGVFIEAGAQNGEYLSNTLYFERYLGWTGLLVEPSPINYKVLKTKNRNSYISNVCLSPQKHPLQFNFNGHQIFEKNVQLTDISIHSLVQCLPLYSILLAIDPPMVEIDYFSLDVDGPELEILKTIPWNKVNIKVLSIEFRHSPYPVNLQVKKEMIDFMMLQGYEVHKEMIFDIFFYKKNGTE
ncbi:unnamed protein product [Gordionus sp. m RMFG-2023]